MSPGGKVLWVLGGHAAVWALLYATTFAASDESDPNCVSFGCFTPREEGQILVMVLGVPILAVSLLIWLAVLAIKAARSAQTRPREFAPPIDLRGKRTPPER